MHFVRLLDDQTFEFVSTYPLDQFECGCSILSCSFSDDTNVYYCVGTAYVMPEENEPTKVSSLLFLAVSNPMNVHLYATVHVVSVTSIMVTSFFSLSLSSAATQFSFRDSR